VSGHHFLEKKKNEKMHLLCGNGHIGHIHTQLRHNVIVNKHGGQVWNAAMGILRKMDDKHVFRVC